MTQHAPQSQQPQAAQPLAIDFQNVDFHYELHRTNVISNVNLQIAAGSFTGLLGRNGSGKSTLALLVGGQLRPQNGQILVDGMPVFENTATMAAVCNSGDAMAVFGDEKMKKTLKLWRETRPNWDENFAQYLLDLFKLNPKKKPDKLSRGQKSAFFAILGLASRCPITIFDEVHLGMDAVARELFYRTLLADYAQNPRTIIMSSHLIEEVEDLLDSVVFIDQGAIIEYGDIDDVRERHRTNGKLPNLTEVLMDLTLTPAQRDQFLKGESQS